MYENFKTTCKVKHENTVSESFMCTLGVRQGESLSPFLFSMYLNDIEEYFILNGFQGVDIGMLKLFLLLYADDIVIFAENENDLQHGLNLLANYCDKWKLQVNVNKTKVIVFKKGGANKKNMKFTYKQTELEIVKKFVYLGVVFTVGGSFNSTYESLYGQAIKAVFKLKSYFVNYPCMNLRHKLDLFDKLIEPILCYGCELWGVNESTKLENVHIDFCKYLLGVRKQTPNVFIYSELDRYPLYIRILPRVIKYWFKLINTSDLKYTKCIYNMMLEDLDEYPEKSSWARSIIYF